MRAALVVLAFSAACVPDPAPAARAPDASTREDARAPGVSDDGGVLAPDALPAQDAAAPDASVEDAAVFADAEPRPDAASSPDAARSADATAAADAAPCDPMVPPPAAHEGLVEAPGLGGCPPGMVLAGTACIDQYEAVLFEVGTGLAWSPFFNPGMRRVRAASIAGVTPQGYITGRQAGAACQEANKRLCTDAEWLRACKGANAQTYPYGPTRQPGVCNDARAAHPAVEYFGTSADWIWSELGNACINQLHDSVAPTGSYTGCVTAEQVFDLMGNLHEWTADPAGTFRGGYYVDTYRNGNGCDYRTTAHDTGHWDYSTGFRCCADPP